MAEEVVEQVIEAVFEELTHEEPVFQIGLPTLERPFGIALWPIFRQIVIRASAWDPDTFMYHYDSELPMAKVWHVTLAIFTYYVVIFGGRWALRNVRPIRLETLFKAHNFLLTFLSGVLLVLLVEQVLPQVLQHGIFYAICSSKMWTSRTVLLFYLNYLTKFYELLDTVFLVLRKRPLTFLHTYHHGATALLCFNQLNGNTSVSWVPIVLNLGVHVLMYWYYFLSACKIRPWWKAWVTRFQIIQFIIDLGFCYFACYTYFASHYYPHMPNMGTCAGEESAAIGGCLILTSYLVLFISFYIKVYLSPQPKVAKGAKASAEVAVEAAAAVASGAGPSEGRQLRSRKA